MIDFLHTHHIVVCRDRDLALNLVLNELENYFYKVLDFTEFKLDMVKSLIKSVHLTNGKRRFFIIRINKINSAAQNALLKLLEESIYHNVIIFIVPNKSIFLPTIRSRLPIRYCKSPKKELHVDFNFYELSLRTVFHYLAKNRFIDKQKAFDLLFISLRFIFNIFILNIKVMKIYNFLATVSKLYI